MLLPPEKMSAENLESRVNFHRATAAMYRQHGEVKAALEFEDLSQRYQSELDKRKGQPKDPEVWSDPDR